MRIHLIAMGGAVMHNLALALQNNHHTVSGSDDEIYNPARDRLANAGLLPQKMGWDADRISEEIDGIILGMHAKPDNPELLKAQELGLAIYSFPEFIYKHSANKKRIVIAGSHGKTSTTAMIMHILKKSNTKFDYLVGAQLEGFDTMVQLSDAPYMIIEGDEYLSSPLDRRPKFLHYKPHLCVVTGIAHDHVNVFPDFKIYKNQFSLLAEGLDSESKLFYFGEDKNMHSILQEIEIEAQNMPYFAFDYEVRDGKTIAFDEEGNPHILPIFGKHNLENLKAAYLIALSIGVGEEEFWEAAETFTGAARRLQLLEENSKSAVYLDFAHAPSKVRATVNALKGQYPERQLIAVYELHTFSSLSREFLPDYKDTMEAADLTIIFFSEHTLKMKNMPVLSKGEVEGAFHHENITVFTDADKLSAMLRAFNLEGANLLLMSSGNFGGIDLSGFLEE